MMQFSALALAALMAASAFAFAAEPDGGHPPAPEIGPEAATGLGIQRPMTLMATSTAEKRHTVKVLFYGQSITQQDWWKEVARDLRDRFPDADLIIENRSIGGFASQMLVRTAESDLYPFYPDLLIFHVFGAHNTYEDIIRRTRERTTAQVAIWNDHVNWLPSGDPEKDAPRMKGYEWGQWMSTEFIPGVCDRYGCYLMDIRTPWAEYLQANELEPSALLRDGVHLNEWGNFLLAELIKPFLVYRPELPGTEWRDLVRDAEVGEDVRWQDGRLTLEFQGNRVDLISGRRPGQESGTARILIDGRRPSEFPELYVPERVSGTPNIGWPAIKRVGIAAPLVLETWTARVLEINDAADEFTFEIEGSVTGPDGKGSSKERFVSDSGRVVIEPEDWSLDYDRRVSKKPVPAGFECRWRVLPLFVDVYEPPTIDDPSLEYATTVAQGLSNGPHKLELVSATGQPIPVRAIRVFEPPVKAASEGAQ
jgi:hypothetical protein